MTYNVFGGTLSLTQSINQSLAFKPLSKDATGCTSLFLSVINTAVRRTHHNRFFHKRNAN